MANLQPGAAITASSFYSRKILPTSSITPNSSTDTFETLSSTEDEKDEFIEVVEEEWEGDGPPPPRKSTDYQRKSALIINKALPNLPELPPDEIKKENPITKFNQWLKDRYPYVNRYKLPIIISLI